MSTTVPETSDPHRAIGAIVRASGSSFYWAMRLLPRQRRQAMFALYAFCREVDDIADGPGEVAAKTAALAAWREEIGALYHGKPSRPVAQALAEPVRRYAIERCELEAVVAGMEMDLGAGLRAPELAVLRLYCRRVAGAVGLSAVRIFGCTDTGAHRFAEWLGEAMQLTNILRDLDEDAALGRLYLPRELLDAAGIAARDPHEVLRHPALPQVCDALAALAGDAFAAAAAALAVTSNRRRLGPALAMMALYRRLLDRLCRRGWSRPRQRPRLTTGERLLIALRHLVPALT